MVKKGEQKSLLESLNALSGPLNCERLSRVGLLGLRLMVFRLHHSFSVGVGLVCAPRTCSRAPVLCLLEAGGTPSSWSTKCLQITAPNPLRVEKLCPWRLCAASWVYSELFSYSLRTYLSWLWGLLHCEFCCCALAVFVVLSWLRWLERTPDWGVCRHTSVLTLSEVGSLRLAVFLCLENSTCSGLYHCFRREEI